MARRKERTYPELIGRLGRVKFVVLTFEVGGGGPMRQFARRKLTLR